jgi:DNA-damage-inducible protein J
MAKLYLLKNKDIIYKDNIFTLSLYSDIIVIGRSDTMAQTLINIRMDEDLKKSMEHTCQELGMNMTTAFTIFAKKMSREHRIPFDVSVDPFYSQANIQAIKESVEQLKQGKVVTKTMEELEAMENE